MKELVDAIKVHVLTKVDSWPTFDGQDLVRGGFVTASEAGNCIRKLAFSKADASSVVHDENEGIDPDHPDLQADSKYGYFQRGHAIEAWIVKVMKEILLDDEAVGYMGEDQVSLYDNRLRVSGTPDGYYFRDLGDGNVDWSLMEFKSVSSMVMGPKSNHIRQVQVNMGLFRYLAEQHEEGPHAFMCMMGFDADALCPDGELLPWTCARLVYIESNNYFNMKMFEVEYDGGAALMEAAKKAQSLFDEDGAALPPDVLPAEGIEAGGGECRFCEFRRSCNTINGMSDEAAQMEGVTAPVKPALFLSSDEDEAMGQVIAALDEFVTLRDKIKNESALKDELDKEVLRPFCERHGGAVDVYLTNRDTGFSLRLTPIDSMRLDKKLIVDAGLDPLDYSKPSSYTRFDVKEVKD